MVCRSVCQIEADDRGATRVLLFFLQQWTKRVWFSFFLLSFLYFSLLFVLSLVLSFPFPFYFCLVQYSCSFCIVVLYLYLFPPFFTYLLLSFLPSMHLPLLFNSLLIFNFPVPFMVFNSYLTLPPSMSAISSLQYIRPRLLISSLAYFLFLNAFPFRPLHSSAINSILA